MITDHSPRSLLGLQESRPPRGGRRQERTSGAKGSEDERPSPRMRMCARCREGCTQRPADGAQARPQAGCEVRSDWWRSASPPDQHADRITVFCGGGVSKQGRASGRGQQAGCGCAARYVSAAQPSEASDTLLNRPDARLPCVPAAGNSLRKSGRELRVSTRVRKLSVERCSPSTPPRHVRTIRLFEARSETAALPLGEF